MVEFAQKRVVKTGFDETLARIPEALKAEGFGVLTEIDVQETLKKDPFCGHLFAFRGKRAQIVKILFWDGNGLCLFTKRLDRGGFVWPRLTGYEGSITLSPAQLAMLIEGIDWRVPERIWRPALAG